MKNGLTLLLLVLLTPLSSGFVESNILPPEAIHRVHTGSDRRAHRRRVVRDHPRPPHQPAQNHGLFYKLGFPKPLEATLSHEGVGGVRNASRKGLLFIETVTGGSRPAPAELPHPGRRPRMTALTPTSSSAANTSTSCRAPTRSRPAPPPQAPSPCTVEPLPPQHPTSTATPASSATA